MLGPRKNAGNDARLGPCGAAGRNRLVHIDRREEIHDRNPVSGRGWMPGGQYPDTDRQFAACDAAVQDRPALDKIQDRRSQLSFETANVKTRVEHHWQISREGDRVERKLGVWTTRKGPHEVGYSLEKRVKLRGQATESAAQR